jgi:hypothetical protein
MAEESLLEGHQDIVVEEEISSIPDMKRLNIVDEMTMDHHYLALHQEPLLKN